MTNGSRSHLGAAALLFRYISRVARCGIVALVAFVQATVPAHASQQYGVRIDSFLYTAGRVLIYVNESRAAPSCSCSTCGNRWEIVVNNIPSQALMSLLMTAYAQGRAVDFLGSNACVGTSNDTEGVNLVSIH
jgi:hypothetical protein